MLPIVAAPEIFSWGGGGCTNKF